MFYFESLILAYFVFVSSYSLIMAVGGFFYTFPKVKINSDPKHHFAILIPGYKEDEVIIETVLHARNQTYSKAYFDVVVIADSFSQQTLDQLRNLDVTVIEVSFEKSTKVKSLQVALQTLSKNYEYVLLLDADNTIDTNFLNQVNDLINYGFRAIQAQRVSKNKDTSMAILDGVSEGINNFIYRQGTVSVGLSSALIGSGMIFQYPVFKDIILSLDSIGGFDRELELALLRKKIKIFYAKGVFVQDEKVSSSKVFENQRRRWISSQFVYFKKYFSESWILLFKGNFEFFHSGFIQNIQLPRLLNLGGLFSLALISSIFGIFYYSYSIWIALLLINIVTLLIAVPRNFYNKDLLKAIFIIPTLFFKLFSVMFTLKGANKKFIHTPHGAKKSHIKFL